MTRNRRRKPFPYAAARRIAMLVLDVDGILTDGGLYYDATGGLMKRFDVHDGLGVSLAHKAGISVAIISGMQSIAVEFRSRHMNISECHLGIKDKIACLDALRVTYGLEWEQIAYMGDDWVDLEVMRMVGLAISVPNGQPEVRARADYVTRASGGRGAVREAIRKILTASGKFEECLNVPKGNQ